jgi:hypothetical protein
VAWFADIIPDELREKICVYFLDPSADILNK